MTKWGAKLDEAESKGTFQKEERGLKIGKKVFHRARFYMHMVGLYLSVYALQLHDVLNV